jgi:hypothetical protein
MKNLDTAKVLLLAAVLGCLLSAQARHILRRGEGWIGIRHPQSPPHPRWLYRLARNVSAAFRKDKKR